MQDATSPSLTIMNALALIRAHAEAAMTRGSLSAVFATKAESASRVVIPDASPDPVIAKLNGNGAQAVAGANKISPRDQLMGAASQQQQAANHELAMLFEAVDLLRRMLGA